MWVQHYEITALILISLLLIFYHLRRGIPMKRNQAFDRLMNVEFLLIVSDLIACYVSTAYGTYPKWVLWISNMFYFGFLFTVYFLFYNYCRVMSQEYSKEPFQKYNYAQIPYSVIMLLVLTTPYTKWIFQITDQGYVRGAAYNYLVFPFFIFYMLFSVVFVYRYRDAIPVTDRISVYAFIFSMTVTSLAQMFIFPDYLLTNIGIIFGIIIVYLALQNPEYDIDSKTQAFSGDGFERYVGERIRAGEPVDAIGFTFGNYHTIQSVFGDKLTDQLLRTLGQEFMSEFHDTIPFYFHRGSFVFVLKEHTKMEEVQERLEAKFTKFYPMGQETVELQLRLIFLRKDRQWEMSAQDVREILQMGLQEVGRSDFLNYMEIGQEHLKALRRKNAIRTALHDALEHDHLKVYYQPIYDNVEHRVNCAEALARIEDPKLGVISPDDFIPVAEEDGTIIRLGAKIYRQVCKFMHDYDMEELGLEYIEVNLSGRQCLHKGLDEDILAIAREYGVSLERMCFEITETAMTDVDNLKVLMEKLSAHGAGFALDDYGTGFSNLINILSLPFDIVKIDKSIVWSYFAGTDTMLPKMVDMFNADQLKVVAEGVEDEIMRSKLREMRCRYEQGFYYSKPIGEEDFIHYMEMHSYIK